MKKHNWLTILIAFILMIGSTGTSRSETSYDSIGSIVILGHYEQDGNEENGVEPIEWIVLDVQDGRSLLLSRYLLDVHPYHEKNEDITWQDCSLRKWLNEEFMQAAFTPAELMIISETTVDNSQRQGYKRYTDTKGGANTTDRIFLLSYEEVVRYLGDISYGNCEKARAELTEYSLQKGIKIGTPSWRSIQAQDRGKNWYWWLRSPGFMQNAVAAVNADGSLESHEAVDNYTCVRPAIWVEISTAR